MFSLYDIYCIFTFSTSLNSNENKAQYNILYVGEKRQIAIYLVGDWLIFGHFTDSLDLWNAEVGNSDRSGQFQIHQFLHRLKH